MISILPHDLPNMERSTVVRFNKDRTTPKEDRVQESQVRGDTYSNTFFAHFPEKVIFSFTSLLEELSSAFFTVFLAPSPE